MNKMKIVVGGCLMLGAVTAFAAPYYAEVTTDGVEGDTGSYASCYTAYLCTATDAVGYFGGQSSVEGITGWLAESGDNYTIGMTAIRGGTDTAMAYYGFYRDAYSFTWDDKTALSGDYIAVVAYANGDDNQFRVFGNIADVDGTVTMDAVGGVGQAGAWTAATVPEPTSGLLLLFGVAGLALRRRRAA